MEYHVVILNRQVLQFTVLAYLLDLLLLVIALAFGFVLDAAFDNLYQSSAVRQLALFMPAIAGIVGLVWNYFRQRRTSLFLWVLPLVLFAFAAWDLYTTWDPSWARVPQQHYVIGSLFGPDCQSQECLYTLPTDILLASLCYTLGAAVSLVLRRRYSSRPR
jgi:hypothetical protein